MPHRLPLAAMIRVIVPTLCLCLAFLAPAAAHSYKLGPLAIGHVWAKPAEKGGKAAIYVPVFNQGRAPVQLVGVTTKAADKAALVTADKDGARPVGTVTFAPGKPLALAPWRQHIELKGLKKAYAAGDSFEITLDFAKAGTITVRVEVSNEGGH